MNEFLQNAQQRREQRRSRRIEKARDFGKRLEDYTQNLEKNLQTILDEKEVQKKAQSFTNDTNIQETNFKHSLQERKKQHKIKAQEDFISVQDQPDLSKNDSSNALKQEKNKQNTTNSHFPNEQKQEKKEFIPQPEKQDFTQHNKNDLNSRKEQFFSSTQNNTQKEPAKPNTTHTLYEYFKGDSEFDELIRKIENSQEIDSFLSDQYKQFEQEQKQIQNLINLNKRKKIKKTWLSSKKASILVFIMYLLLLIVYIMIN
ncbi:hypothetical protein DMB95_00795 [Campylobacter sp. MIT 12-8780]|uniref:hypothetical protein n=1 Tax=unclassified Campylobacter TaxID=2593542 RepID=UPI00115ECE67|nr:MULTISPECIES: hypothetical protein [unclassified Campylobacter]NDJ26497.1 hypothetical protein [Campylobacter sp. MIT 19-121]TQR43069.1 hypothetical protein DMB95_00795 [Campylobacter sp. MIT 12-8780]